MHLRDGVIQAELLRPSGWTNLIFNYLSTNEGDGIQIFYNGEEVGSNSNKQGGPLSTGNGRLVVGRRFTKSNQDYASVEIDELVFFNRALSNVEVESIYESI